MEEDVPPPGPTSMGESHIGYVKSADVLWRAATCGTYAAKRRVV